MPPWCPFDRLAQRPALSRAETIAYFPIDEAVASADDVWAPALRTEAFQVYYPLLKEVLPYCQWLHEQHSRWERKEWSYNGAVRTRMVGVPGPSPDYSDHRAGYSDLGNAVYFGTVQVGRRLWSYIYGEGRDCPYLCNLNTESCGDHLEAIMGLAYLNPGNVWIETKRDIVEVAAKFTADHWTWTQTVSTLEQHLLSATLVPEVCMRFHAKDNAERELNILRLCRYVPLWLHKLPNGLHPMIAAFLAHESPRYIKQLLSRLSVDEFCSFFPRPRPLSSMYN